MPLYDYKCSQCEHIFEVQQRITEEPLEYCPKCKGPIKRLISAAGIIFKGSGFHVNDYGKSHKHSTKNTTSAVKTDKPEPKKEETKKSESKEVSK